MSDTKVAGNPEAGSDNYIRDGLIEDGYIEANPGLWVEERFTYRPALGQVAEKCDHEISVAYDKANDGELAYLKHAELVAKHLKTWSRSETIEVKSLLCIRRQVLIRMYKIITGTMRSDADPTKPTPGKASADDQLKKQFGTTE